MTAPLDDTVLQDFGLLHLTPDPAADLVALIPVGTPNPNGQPRDQPSGRRARCGTGVDRMTVLQVGEAQFAPSVTVTAVPAVLAPARSALCPECWRLSDATLNAERAASVAHYAAPPGPGAAVEPTAEAAREYAAQVAAAEAQRTARA